MRPTVAFFNNKGGVGKTTLVFHVAWMLRELGRRVVVVDLDPQANLTSSFLTDAQVEDLWTATARRTVYGALEPLLEGEGGIQPPRTQEIVEGLALVAGDLALSGSEQELSTAWPNAGDGQRRAFRVLSAFSTVAKAAADSYGADITLLDVGPNLGAINRAAMVASTHVVVPLAPDLYSLQGLRNLGPSLMQWRDEWRTRLETSPLRHDELPAGEMRPAGYVVLQHGVRLDRVVGAYDRWLQRVPQEYRTAVLGHTETVGVPVEKDPHCLGLLKHYHSLIPMGQEARKPIFLLRSADGAIGAHQQAVQAAHGHFQELTEHIVKAVTEE
ncbi:MAG: ParA family protein [Kineosporiaceae bacterium]